MKHRNNIENRCKKRRRLRSMRLESLDRRDLMTTFGTPWPDARSLTVSFPSDDAEIGGYQNSLRSVLDQVADRKEWQEAVLRAFQTWAVESNINVGLATDRGDNFGAVGLTQNDPRFGDFRIGGLPQTGVLANATPFQTNAGTWAGDLLFNTQSNFFLDEWKLGTSVQTPSANERGPAIELFSVALHEAGNALGLADVNRPGTVMHQSYTRPIGAIAPTDRNAIRAIYGGARRDIFEIGSNNTRSTATIIDQRPSNGGRLPIIRKGSLNTPRDIDFYRFAPVSNQEKVTVRLRANGISLLKSQLSVTDARGNVIASAKADSIFDNDLKLEIGSLKHHRQLFVRVSGNGTDVFTVGDYALEIDYRPKDQQPIITPLVYDADAVDDDSNPPYLAGESVDQIFASAGLIDRERGVNETFSTATRLQTAIGFNQNTRYETIGSLTNADTDFLVFRSPVQAASTMSIRIESLGLSKATIHADVFDQLGKRVRATATPTADGSVSFLVNAPSAGSDYFLRVRAKNQSVATGNYVATVDFAIQSANVATTAEQIAIGIAPRGQPVWSLIEVYKTQLFRFDLTANATSSNSGVRMTVYDARRANVVFSMATAAGSPEVAFVLLQQGRYAVLIEALGRNGIASSPVGYSLSAIGISDDLGPLPSDPYGGYYPSPSDPYGGPDPYISPYPDPHGGGSPFPFPDPTPDQPAPPGYDQPEQYNPWYDDPYYDYYQDEWQYG